MFMLHGRLAATPGKRDELLAIMSEGERDEPMPGCRLYLVAVDETDPDGVWVGEGQAEVRVWSAASSPARGGRRRTIGRVSRR